MILGACPTCDESLMIPLLAGQLPSCERHDCDPCGEVLWTKHSRWNPWSLTEDEFFKEYTVGPGKEVSLINKNSDHAKEERAEMKEAKRFLGITEVQ